MTAEFLVRIRQLKIQLRRWCGLFAFSTVLAPGQQAVAQSPDAEHNTSRASLRVGLLGSGFKLDGKLDDAAWARADSIATLTQTEPVEGALPSARTVVRVLADGGGLVFGIRADDPDASRITAFARARDADLSSEDNLKIVLDTYLDGRSGFVFAVNANGARYDALVINQGEGENANWDAAWEAATARTATGWSAEIRIPARSLLFRRGLTSWSFNVQRRSREKEIAVVSPSPVGDAMVKLV